MVSYINIHKKLNLSGNAQFVSGIRQTADGRGFVLIAMSSSEYTDTLMDNGTLMYMGHGSGDQKMWMDNKKLSDSPMDTPLYVFRHIGPHKYSLMGVFKKNGAVIEEIRDGRRVFLFPLKKCTPVVDVQVVDNVPDTLSSHSTNEKRRDYRCTVQ